MLRLLLWFLLLLTPRDREGHVAELALLDEAEAADVSDLQLSDPMMTSSLTPLGSAREPTAAVSLEACCSLPSDAVMARPCL